MDAAKHEGQLHYVPVLHESYYSIHPPVACRVGKQMIPVPAKHWGLTVIDSGTNHVLLPSRVLDALKPALGREAPEPLSRVFDELCVAVPQETLPPNCWLHTAGCFDDCSTRQACTKATVRTLPIGVGGCW